MLCAFVLYSTVRALLVPRIVTPVLEIRSDDVRAIEVACGEPTRIPFEAPEVDRLTRRASIESIVSALHVAKPYSPNHPSCGSACKVTLQREGGDGDLSFAAAWNCRRSEQDALIRFWSQATWGLSLGTYRSPELGKKIGWAIVDERYGEPEAR